MHQFQDRYKKQDPTFFQQWRFATFWNFFWHCDQKSVDIDGLQCQLVAKTIKDLTTTFSSSISPDTVVAASMYPSPSHTLQWLGYIAEYNQRGTLFAARISMIGSNI